MIFNVKNSYLMAYEFSGIHADFTAEKLEPIRMGLSAEGGSILIKAIWLDFKNEYYYLIIYRTLCHKISIKYELSKEAFDHNLEFFGDEYVQYDSAITFNVENDKFKLP